MDVFSLVAKITLDTTSYDHSLSSAEQKFSGFGSKLSTIGSTIANGFVTLVKTGTVAIGGATAAVGAFGAAAVSSYANYEQLVGGVDKLYGTASRKLQDYADKAYLTAGMSTNAYMETATSFSAALIKSLNGDVDAAADITDVAMKAMSDNVNVFGSDFASVQYAFQGFAKQNYTMLDNLKLGYGGTKQEMERLIEDANKYRESIGQTADLSIDSFADIVQAIQSIQEAQNIAGTTNAEAMKTIEGSANATKAAWQNVITAIGRGEGLSDAFNGFITAIFGEKEGEGLLNQIIPRIQIVMKGIGEFIGTAAPMITKRVPELVSSIVPTMLSTGMQLLEAITKGILDNLPALGNAAIQVVQILGTKLIENVPALLDKGRELGNNIIKFITEGFSENHSDILTGVQTVITAIAEQFFSFRDKILNTGLDIIQWLSEGIFENVPTVIDAIVNVIESIFTYMTQSLPDIYDRGMQTIGMFADGLMANVPYLINKAAELLNMLVDFIVQNGPKFVESAANLIMQMQEGFTNETPNIINKMGDILVNLLDKILDNLPQFLERGVQIVYNMATGVLKNLPEILAAMVTLLGKVLFTIWSHLPQFAESAVRIIGIMATSIISTGPQLLQSFADVMNGIHDWFWEQDWASIGVHIMEGLIDGVTSMIGALMDVVSDIVDSISSAFEDALEIHSPSKVFWRYGKMLDMGLAEGITDNVGSAESAMGNLSNSLKIGSDRGMDTGMATQPQNTANVGGSFVFNQTINAPQELDPSEIARQSRNAMRATVLQLRMA